MIKPVSEADEEEGDEADEFEEAGEGREDVNEDDNLASGRTRRMRSSNYDVRNRKWRKRIEYAIFKMTTEIAALREQIEAKRGAQQRPRKGLWAWLILLTWAAIKHVTVDAALFGIALLWARRKDDRRLEQGLRLLLRVVVEQIHKMRTPRWLRYPE